MFHFNEQPKVKGPTIACKECHRQFVRVDEFIICKECKKKLLGDASMGVTIRD